MRRTAVFTAAFALFATVVMPAVSQAGPNGMTVPVDQSRRVPFNGAAASVIPGNADLIYSYIVSPTDVRVVGRKLGVTNLVVLDARGQTLFDKEVVVSAGDGSVVTIYRDGKATDYACSPYCAPAQGTPGFQPGQTSATAAGFVTVGQALANAAGAAAAPAPGNKAKNTAT
jgi:hypothetical protein